jgi:hypothetical protein
MHCSVLLGKVFPLAFFEHEPLSVLCHLKLLSIRDPKTMKPFFL